MNKSLVNQLTGAKRREWMGCWGLLGWLLLVIMDIINPKIPCVKRTSKSMDVDLPMAPWHVRNVT